MSVSIKADRLGSYAIIGAKGMLGRALQEQLTSQGRPFSALDLPEFDMTNRLQVEMMISGGCHPEFSAGFVTTLASKFRPSTSLTPSVARPCSSISK